MYFCIRDDDTSFFTLPEQLEDAYGEISKWGPVSLAVVPFHRAGTSKAVPDKFLGRWTVHPLHENRPLVEYLRARVAEGRFEIMLHGYHHDEPSGGPEFLGSGNLAQKVSDGRKYLEDVLGTPIAVFVPPHNTIGRKGLQAVIRARLHLGCLAGFRSGWSPFTGKAWRTWIKLRKWQSKGGLGVPWTLNLGDHREIAGNPVTPTASFTLNKARFETALQLSGVFCAATHYWELPMPSANRDDPPVQEHLRRLIDRARSDSRVVWRTVGESVLNAPSLI